MAGMNVTVTTRGSGVEVQGAGARLAATSSREDEARSDAQPGALIRRLTSQVRAIEGWSGDCAEGGGGGVMRSSGWIPTGWPAVDQALAIDTPSTNQTAGSKDRTTPGTPGISTPSRGLPQRAIHEWFGLDADTARWTPAICILAHLAGQAFPGRGTGGSEGRRGSASSGDSNGASGCIAWIGRRVWPHPQLLDHIERGRRLLDGSVFIDLGSNEVTPRLWAIDLALRNPAIKVVIADGCRFDMAATRRLLLAAESTGTMGLLARPPGERSQRSAAVTRWNVVREASPGTTAQWTIKLIRCRYVHRAGDCFSWTLRWDHETGTVIVPTDVVDRSGQTQGSRTAVSVKIT